MAYTTINKSSDYFNTKLYTGNGSTQSITGVGFQPDWLWIKNRDGTNNHILQDAVRGATKSLESDGTGAETTSSTRVTSFDSDGFSIGSAGTNNTNTNNYVSWNWKANGQGSANTDGDITSTVSTNTTAGFSIVKYTGDGTTGQTVGHGLGSVPKLIINKQLTSQNWFVYHHSIGNTKVLKLNTTDAETTTSGWNNTTPTSSVFTIGTSSSTNVSGVDFINYCFAEKTGFSKFGSYTGNGNADGAFIYTGFKPAWIMLKDTNSGSAGWMMFDNKRLGYNVDNNALYPNATAAEGTGDDVDLLSNGFKARSTDAGINTSGNSYIYMAFGQSLVGSNNIPCTAR
jgi:hypothetical protein